MKLKGWLKENCDFVIQIIIYAILLIGILFSDIIFVLITTGIILISYIIFRRILTIYIKKKIKRMYG